MPSALGTQVLQEQREWTQFVHAALGADAQLHYVSSYDSDRRVYWLPGRIAKVRRRWGDGAEQLERQFGQELRQEFEILRHLDRVASRRFDASYHVNGGWEYLLMNQREGLAFRDAWEKMTVVGRMRLAGRVARTIAELNQAGVYHADVVPNNLIVGHDGRVRAVDFGNAKLVPPPRSHAMEWTRLLLGRHGLFAQAAKNATVKVAPWVQDVYRSLRANRVRPFKVTDSTDPNLLELEQAWRLAARWHTSIDAWLAYPSITIAGTHFPGQRPFLMRWNQIAQRVDFNGKSVLDLGCNIGLLPTFASLAGATRCRGVDSDPLLVDAARHVASAFGADCDFEVADIDAVEPGSDSYVGWDVVCAMSIFEWVKDRERLLATIGHAKEVIFEGHESEKTERDRLRRIGYRHVSSLGRSERGRPLFHATR